VRDGSFFGQRITRNLIIKKHIFLKQKSDFRLQKKNVGGISFKELAIIFENYQKETATILS
jgi:hypothetical protein